MGRLLDSLSFNLPQQQEVITSDPSKAPGQEYVQSYLAQGAAQSKRVAQFRNLVGAAAGLGFDVLKPIVAKEREEKERAGRVYGLENLQGIADLSGSYEQKSLQLRERFRTLRNNDEINIIDDPYFQKGLDTAYGITSIKQYDQAAGALYEKLSSAPDFYNNPDKFETEWRRLFDSFYVSLPENTVLQEAFLSKAGPIQDKYLQAYKAASNEWYRKEFVQQKQESLLAAEFVFDETLRSFESLNGNDITEQYTNFTIDLINGLEEGTITPEQIKAYTGFDVQNGDELYKVLQGVWESEDPEQAIRSFLKGAAKVDLIDDVRNIYDEFYNFAGQGRGALDIDPSDLIITTLTKGFQDPQTAMEVLNGLPSGTGMLRDTDKGKAGLLLLQEAAEKQAAQDRKQELDLYKLNREEFKKGIALQRADIDAKISSFDDILSLKARQGEPLSPTDLYQSLEADIYSLYTDPKTGEIIDIEEVAGLMGKLKKQLYDSFSLSETEQKRIAVGNAFNEVMGLTQSESDVEDKTASMTAFELVQLNSQSPEYTSDLIEGRTGELHSAYMSEDREEADITSFWNHVRVLNNYNDMNSGSRDIRVSPLYSSEDIVLNNPALLQTMIEADANYDALATFVSPESEIYKIVQDIGQNWLELGGNPDNLAQMYVNKKAEYVKEEEEKEKKAEKTKKEAALRDRLGFDPDSIPLPSDSGKYYIGGVVDLMANIPGIGTLETVEEYPKQDLMVFMDAYGELFTKYYGVDEEGGYSKGQAAALALRDFKKRFKLVEIADKSWDWDNGINMIVDNGVDVDGLPVNTYFESIEPDEEERYVAIQELLRDMRYMTNNRTKPAATAWLAQHNRNMREALMNDWNSEWEGSYQEDYIDTRNVENSPVYIEAFYSELEDDEEAQPYIPHMKAAWDDVFGESAINRRVFLVDSSIDNLAKKLKSSVDADPNFTTEKLTTLMEYRQLIFDMNKSAANKLSIQEFDPRWRAEQKKLLRTEYRQELDEGGLENAITSMYGEEVAEAFGTVDAFIANTSLFDLDDTDFDWDSEDLTLMPTQDGRYYIKDEQGITLKYTLTNAPFTLDPRDIGDRLKTHRLYDPVKLWGAVQPIVNPQSSPDAVTTDEELKAELGNFFADWPKNLTIVQFQPLFGENSYDMYWMYKSFKENN